VTTVRNEIKQQTCYIVQVAHTVHVRLMR